MQPVSILAAFLSLDELPQKKGVCENVVVSMEGPRHVGAVLDNPVQGRECLVAQQAVVVGLDYIVMEGDLSHNPVPVCSRSDPL